MATEPTDLPLWSTDENPVSNAQPSVGKIAAGFSDQEQPPRQDFNYLYNNIGKWTEFHKQQENLSTTNINDVITAGGFNPVSDPDKLLEALNALIDKQGIWVDATQFGLVTGSPPAGTNKDALNAAFAASPYVFMPPGIYELDGINGNVVPPSGGVLAGSGVITTLQFTDNSVKFDIKDKNVVFRDFKVDGNSTNTSAFKVSHTLENVTSFINLQFSNFGGGLQSKGIDTSNTNDAIGLCIIQGCVFLSFQNDSFALAAPSSGSTESCRVICRDSRFEDCNVQLDGETKATRRFTNNIFFDGSLGFGNSFNTMFTENSIDVDALDFLSAKGPKFINNFLPGTLANTFGITLSDIVWRDNKNLNGLTPTHFSNINGGFSKREITIAKVFSSTSTYVVIDWDSVIANSIANQILYSNKVLYDTAADVFNVHGLGDGTTRIQCMFSTDGSDAVNERAGVFVNNVQVNLLSQTGVGGGGLIYSFNGVVATNIGDTVSVRFFNASGGNVSILLNTGEFLAAIEVEGL